MHGWLLMDKPKGISSAAALNPIKQLLRLSNMKTVKVGHAGTLDPFACGLLLVAIGEATKTMEYAMHGTKDYEFTIAWGENRDTYDDEGIITSISHKLPNSFEIMDVIPK